MVKTVHIARHAMTAYCIKPYVNVAMWNTLCSMGVNVNYWTGHDQQHSAFEALHIIHYINLRLNLWQTYLLTYSHELWFMT